MADERASHRNNGSSRGRSYGSSRGGNGNGRNGRSGSGFRGHGNGGGFHRSGNSSSRRYNSHNRDDRGYRHEGDGEYRRSGDGERRFRDNDHRRDFHRDNDRRGNGGFHHNGDRRNNGERRGFRHDDDRRDYRRRDDRQDRGYRRNDDRRDRDYRDDRRNNRDDRRDFNRGNHRDDDRRDFKRDNRRNDDRRDFKRNDRHGNGGNPRYRRDDRNDDRRDFNREERQAYRDRKRDEYMSKSRKNSDGTVSFPSQNPYERLRPGEPKLPKGLEWSMLSKDERERLRGLSKEHAENIGLHILAAYTLEANDPQAALAHAQWAAKQASRVDIARETLAMVAYRQGDYKLALREFQTAFRMNGYLDYLPFMADCERGLGKPKKAIELCLSDNAKQLTGEAKAEMFLVYAGALADLKLWDQAIEVVSKLVHAKGLAGEYRMRAAQAEQYFLEEAGRSDDAVAMDELIDDLEDRYADADEDETSDDFVVDYDVEDLPEDLQAKLGVTPDDAQYAPFDGEDGVNMDDETRILEEEQRSGAEMDIEPAQMEERNTRRDEEGEMGDPDLTDAANDVDEEDAQIGDSEEEIEDETE